MPDSYGALDLTIPNRKDRPNVVAAFEEFADSLGTALEAALAALLPVGMIIATGRSAAPTGYLMCDGSAVKRSDHPELFTAIGTTYGKGDGSTTFNVPDLRGRIPVGVDGAAGRLSANDALGNSSGEETHSLVSGEMPSHNHGVTDPGHFHAVDVQNFEHWSASGPQETTVHVPTGLATRSAVTGISIQNAGGGGAHNNLQPYQVVNYLIKL